MQITKIKNKQTGEVYDIGGSNKLKLIAEGQMIQESLGVEANLEEPLEINKIYLFQSVDSVMGGYIDVYFKTNSELGYTSSTITYLYELEEDLAIVCKFIYYDNKIEILPMQGGEYVFYANEFRIYELPFSL